MRKIPGDPEKSTPVCKINNKRGIFKIKVGLNYQRADVNFDILVLIVGYHLTEISMFKVK